MSNYMVTQLDSLESVECPCGYSRRAFAGEGNSTATAHLVDIRSSSRTHYHKKMAEVYVVLEGVGHIELDGKSIPVKPLTAVFIKPGCRHRAIGKLRIINFVTPPFDTADEWFD